MDHPFEEVLGVRFVVEQKPNGVLFDLEAMEEQPVLGVLEVHPELLVPQHALVADDVYQFEEEGVSNQVVHQNQCSHQSCPCPVISVWVVHIEPDHCCIDYFV